MRTQRAAATKRLRELPLPCFSPDGYECCNRSGERRRTSRRITNERDRGRRVLWALRYFRDCRCQRDFAVTCIGEGLRLERRRAGEVVAAADFVSAARAAR